MLYLIFTVDGDWEEYYDPALSEEKRKPDFNQMLSWLEQEKKVAARFARGRFIHFIHTSPRAREFFLKPEFLSSYREMVDRQGDVGIHCHEDDPHRAYYSDDQEKMGAAIGSMAGKLKEKGFSPLAYRAGYLSFSPKTIPILERNGIPLDFSCEPGRYLFHEQHLVSDWRGAPFNFYRMDSNDHRRPGNSKVFEVPMAFYLERDPILKLWRKAKGLKASPEKIIVTVLAHSYEFGPFLKKLKIKLALWLLGKYGIFINAKEALALIRGEDIK